MRVKPPVPEDVRRPQGPGPADVIRRRLVAWAHQAADGGMPGLRSSRAVVICGFPRSGSTLLQLMLEAAYPHAKQFGREVVTDCPTLLALPALQKRVGFAEIERLDLTAGTEGVDETAELPLGASPPRAQPSSEATA